ncbi:HigA family addiction module antitoxin [Arenivirga flava]|uniref:XRE family transcriptional regulator n=1 Tax=Arenivirga flava TaxID=1930060 RepID=A0AA37UKC7_9MICO|nr:HigA family addiction module antitoxin [Arenivirga flava]GMA28886.1 XRE family transcriptional regulator [Arenivirga flava]
MAKYAAREPQFDFAPRPGRMLQRELDAHSISQAQLAARTGLSTKHINLVIKGTAPLSPDVAVTLEQVLGTSAETWLRLEAANQTQQARAERLGALSAFTEWASSFPRRILVDRGIVDEDDTSIEVVQKLLRFFGVAAPGAFAKTWLEPQASYKRSQLLDIDMNLTALWLRLSELHASTLIEQAPAFDPEKLRKAADLIPKLTTKKTGQAFREAQDLLLDSGVVLVFVPEMPNTRISGVSRWVNGTPMIAVTSRYKGLDSFWFTVLHEVAHVLLHPKRSTFVDGLKADDDADAQEVAANKFAEARLVPPTHLKQLRAATTPEDIRLLAKSLGISPGIVAGQWAYQTGTWGGPIAKLREQVDLAELAAS